MALPRAGAWALSLLLWPAAAHAPGFLGPWTSLPVVDRAAFRAVAFSAAQPGRLFAAGPVGVWRSDNHGDSWVRIGRELPPDLAFSILAASAADADLAFATTCADSVLYRTTDAGAHWARTAGPPGGGPPAAFLLDATDPLTLWAGTRAGPLRGAWRSTDGGGSWTQRSAGLLASAVDALAAHPTNPSLLLAGTGDGIARSTDAGASWSWVYVGSAVLELDWNVAQPDVVWARPQAMSLLRSTDAGRTWSSIPQPEFPRHLAADPANPQTLLAGLALLGCGPDGYGYFGSVSRSTDAGTSWTAVRRSTACDGGTTAVAFDPSSPNRAYAVFGEGFWRSDAGGAAGSWVEHAGGVHAVPCNRVRVGAGDHWYVRAEVDRGLFVSTDAGSSWVLHPPARGRTLNLTAFDVSAVTPGLVYEAGYGRDPGWCGTPWPYAVLSPDDGATWAPLNPELFYDLLVVSTDAIHTVYAWDDVTLFRSDDGVTFRCVGDDFRALDAVIVPGGPNALVATVAGRDPVRRSLDGGVSWAPCSSGLPRRGVPVRLLMDPGNSSHLLVAFRGDGVYESTDFATTWRGVPLGLLRNAQPMPAAPRRREAALCQIADAAWDVSGSDHRVFLATDRGVFVEGYGWVDDGLTSLRTTSIAYSRTQQKLLVGTETEGAFALDVPRLGDAPALDAADGHSVATLSLAPNPFVASTSIRFSVPRADIAVRLSVFDATGRRVRSIHDGALPPGERSLSWDGRDSAGRRVAAGVYFLRLDVGGTLTTKRAILLR
ncbi:MAG: FlgD immunoglobulin-like domain containing protein [bacterium]